MPPRSFSPRVSRCTAGPQWEHCTDGIATKAASTLKEANGRRPASAGAWNRRLSDARRFSEAELQAFGPGGFGRWKHVAVAAQRARRFFRVASEQQRLEVRVAAEAVHKQCDNKQRGKSPHQESESRAQNNMQWALPVSLPQEIRPPCSKMKCITAEPLDACAILAENPIYIGHMDAHRQRPFSRQLSGKQLKSHAWFAPECAVSPLDPEACTTASPSDSGCETLSETSTPTTRQQEEDWPMDRDGDATYRALDPGQVRAIVEKLLPLPCSTAQHLKPSSATLQGSHWGYPIRSSANVAPNVDALQRPQSQPEGRNAARVAARSDTNSWRRHHRRNEMFQRSLW